MPSPNSPSPDVLRMQIFRLVDKQLPVDESSELEQLLLHDPDARKLYVNEIDLLGNLYWDNCLDMTAVVNASIRRSHSAPAKSSPDESKADAHTSSGLHSMQLLVRQLAHSSLACSALVALLFYGSFVVLAWNLRPASVSDYDGVQVAFPTVAYVTGLADVTWDPTTKPRLTDTAIRATEPLAIEAGCVELRLNRGVTVLIEGPASWTMDGENEATLHRGKAVAKVPPAAIGFSLNTPRGTVVDLGTEFGVEVTKDRTDVVVFKGQVRFQSAKRNNFAEPLQSRVVNAGEAAQATSGNPGIKLVSSVASDAVARFRRELNDVDRLTAKSVHASDARLPKRSTGSGPNKGSTLSQPAFVLSDTFDGPDLDESKWSVRTDIPAGGAAVSIESGRLKLVNRGYLISRTQFKPTPHRPLRITGTCCCADLGDMFQLLTRADGISDPITGEVLQGLEFYVAWSEAENPQILSRGDPELLFEQTIVEGMLDVKPQMLLNFEMIDSGSAVSFTLQEIGNASNRITIRAKATPSCKAYHVVLHNREREHSTAHHVLYVDELQIEQGANEDLAPIATGKGE